MTFHRKMTDVIFKRIDCLATKHCRTLQRINNRQGTIAFFDNYINPNIDTILIGKPDKLWELSEKFDLCLRRNSDFRIAVEYVFNYDYGLLNQIVKAFGGENVRWLGTDLIFWAMMIAFIFGSVGYYMLIFISGIEGIPQDLYEAATIDGANIFDRFFQITLPLLKGVIRTCVTFWSINATTFFLWTKMFSPINTETATIVPVVYLYDTVFGGKGVVERDAGAGAAVGVVLTLIIIAVYVITNLILKDSDLEY